jgi:hypothetical protein
MIYLIRFGGHPLLYERILIDENADTPPLTPLNDREIYTTIADLEEYASIVKDPGDFTPITLSEIKNGRFSIEAMRTIKHCVDIYGWEFLALVSGRLDKKNHIVLSFGGGEKLWTNSMGFGEPI